MQQGEVYPAQASAPALTGMPVMCKVEEPKKAPKVEEIEEIV